MKRLLQIYKCLFALATAMLMAGGVWASDPTEMVVTDQDRKHWSFLPLTNPPLPSVEKSQSIKNPIDRFVVARLENKELELSSRAEPRKLVRRIYFDLVGLPPSPEQLTDFQAAYTRDADLAITDLIDKLLGSPHYGERWGRHWLDVARYADSDGQESDADRPTAYHYRDFVLRAFNEDMAFDQFVRWQLAGDELEPDNPAAISATGFIVAGTHAVLDSVPMEEEKIRTRFNELDDMIATTGSAMLGLTLACARCHDHKYDPVPRRDYYRMLSAFNGGDRAEIPMAPYLEGNAYKKAQAEWKQAFEKAKKNAESAANQFRKKYEATARAVKIDRLELSDEEKQLLKTNSKDSRREELAKKFSKELKVEDKDWRPLLSDSERDEWDEVSKTLKTLEDAKPKALPTALGFADFGPTPRETWLFGRGDFRAKTERVELGFLNALLRNKTPADYWAHARADTRRPDSSQQRRALAEWLTDPEHGAGALVARVIVNRVWQHHFGEGLVRTVNDFGARAEPPTHPELLEWLAYDFRQHGWKLKRLHRQIMNSAVYLQDSSFNQAKATIDPENRLLARRRPLRIQSEILRDSILSVSGVLNPKLYGPAFKAPIAPEAIQARNMKDPYPKDLKETPSTLRRSVYMFHKRVVQYPLMQAFDGPDAQASCGRRVTTTVAPQALALLNDKFVRSRAEDFARLLRQEQPDKVEDQVRQAWRRALGREISRSELTESLQFIGEQTRRRASKDKSDTEQLALIDLCQAIFALNEFIYVD